MSDGGEDGFRAAVITVSTWASISTKLSSMVKFT